MYAIRSYYDILPISEFNAYIQKIVSEDQDIYLSQQVFTGSMKGETIFILEGLSVSNLVSYNFV